MWNASTRENHPTQEKVTRGGEREKWGATDKAQAFDPSRPTDFGVWSAYLLPNQLSTSNGIPSLIEWSLLLSPCHDCSWILTAACCCGDNVSLCHLGKLMSLQLAPKTFWLAELMSQFFYYTNSSKNITCPSGKLKTEFISPIAKLTSSGLSDTTFFARWYRIKVSVLYYVPK